MKPRKRISQVSARKRRENAVYAKLRKQFLAEHPICQVWLKENGWERDSEGDFVKTGKFGTIIAEADFLLTRGAPRSEDVHHMKGRGRYTLDVSTWLAVSREAHEKIGRYPQWAEERGYLDPRRNVRSSFLQPEVKP